MDKFTNQLIFKITNNLENFSYNVIIANIYEAYNFVKEINKDLDYKNLEANYKKILILFSPAIPHFVAECLEDLKTETQISWPIVDKKYLNEDKIDYVIQINGKKRSILNENRDISESAFLNAIKNKKNLNRLIENKKIKKIFFVKNRLINILIDEN